MRPAAEGVVDRTKHDGGSAGRLLSERLPQGRGYHAATQGQTELRRAGVYDLDRQREVQRGNPEGSIRPAGRNQGTCEEVTQALACKLLLSQYRLQSRPIRGQIERLPDRGSRRPYVLETIASDHCEPAGPALDD